MASKLISRQTFISVATLEAFKSTLPRIEGQLSQSITKM